MLQARRHLNATASADNSRVRSVIALIDSLIAVVAEENVELARGLPASRLRQVEEKTRLADLFERQVAECAGGRISLHVQDRALREELMARILQLRGVMDENVVRLRAAIEASNRRIEAVMQAIRDQITSVSPYAASGRQAARGAISCGTSVRI